MNAKRLIIGIVAVFAGIWVTNFLIHGVWLQSTYAATMSLWRPEAEMKSHMAWLMLGQFLAAAAFVVIWAQGFAATAHFACACIYGFVMGLFAEAGTLITYAVQPLPGDLAVKWFVAGIVQSVLMGILVFIVYKPKQQPSQSSAAVPAPANP